MLLPLRVSTTMVLLALCVGIGGCGGRTPADNGEKGKSMDSTQTRAHIEKTFAEVLQAAGNGSATPVKQTDEIPCGGPGGNEKSKLKTHAVSGIKPVTDPTSAFAAARKLLGERKFTVGEVTTAGTEQRMNFSDDHLTASLSYFPDTKVLSLEGETACVDNAER